MSDPQVPQPDKPRDVDDVVDSAKAGLADAEAAAAGVSESPASEADAAADASAPSDPDADAFAEAEKAYPGTFAAPAAASVDDEVAAEQRLEDAATGESAAVDASGADASDAAAASTEASSDASDPAVATEAYAAAGAAATQVLPAEPVAAPPPQQQPIFVQAPEPPTPLGNRAVAGAIGILAALCFAVLLLGTTVAIGAAAGDVNSENFGEQLLAPLSTWAFWVPVVVFFLGFWLLGAIINRGRWGYWVVFGLLVGVLSWVGHLLGQLAEAPFWTLTPTEGIELVQDQLFAPLAIAAFIFGRELTIWFGAWAARSGARKTELNIEAQREYERTLEAGPSLSR